MALKVSSPSPPGSPPPEMPQPQKSQFANKVAGMAAKSKPKPMVNRGGDKAGRWAKILSYGHSGTGKTFAIIGFLKAGLRVVVISTDLGGNGLASVFNQLEKEGLSHLADNIVHIDFPDYDGLIDFLKDPIGIYPEFYDFKPDFLVWDGFSGFQQQHVSDKIMEITPQVNKVSEGREEGLWKDQQDWGMVRNATLKALANYLALHNWKHSTAINKYMTCLENKPMADKITNEIQRGPYIQGSAAALMAPAFDIIIETRVKSDSSEKVRAYEYYCVGHEKLLAKSRGFDLDPIEPADMHRLWTTKIAPKLNPGTVTKPQEALIDEPTDQ
jgi:hypothetical protein